MWAFALLVVAIAAHAVLVLWLRNVLGKSAGVTLVLVVASLVACFSLFADRLYFGYTSFELAVVALGAGGFVAAMAVRAVVRRRWPPGRQDARTGISEPPPLAPLRPGGPSLPGRRDAFVAVAGGVSWGISGAVLGYGMVKGRHDVEVVETAVTIAGWPKALDGYVIMQISDLHVGTFITEQDLARGLELVKAARPDLLVVTGDVVDFDAGLAPMVAMQIARVAPRDGVFGILGNHDYYADAPTVRAALDSAGIRMLVNGARAVRAQDGGGFTLLGLDDLSSVRHGGSGPDLPGTLALAAPDPPRILLAHQPPQFDAAAGKVALQLSGHTHGLQFDFAAQLGKMAHKYVSGRYVKNGSLLYVNRGFGVTGPPSRVGVRPEITRLVIIAG